nr:hypothetical protein [Nitrosomonas nitrosa]
MSVFDIETRDRNVSINIPTTLWATMSAGLLWFYILTVGFLDEMAAGVKVSTMHIVIATLGGSLVFGLVFVWGQKRGLFAKSSLRDAALSVSTVLLGMVILDVGYSIFLNTSQPPASSEDRSLDQNTWVGELYPGLYFPTEKNFRLHKPGRTIIGSHYGDMYNPRLLSSPTLSSSVFSKKHVTISINEEGFRETAKLEGHKILAIGDSFTFGWGVEQSLTWVELLEHSIGQPIYNMGIHDSSPKQEFLLLEHVLDAQKLDFRGGVLLWMIFEGNDLEDSYDDHRPFQNSGSKSLGLFKDTIIDTALSFPSMLKREAVVTKFKNGRVVFPSLGRAAQTNNHYVIDGRVSAFPLYVSSRFGAKLFIPDQLERVQSPAQYVESHPNASSLQKTFERMKTLSNQWGFRVVVIIAPSDSRMHGGEFEDFPRLSEKPHFNMFVERLAGQSGFEVTNLEKLLRPLAANELLYFRDDDHWNERGHAAVADILGRFLRSRNIINSDGKGL